MRSVRVPIIGASQRGKTTFAKRLCAELARRGAAGSLVIFDQKYPDRAQYEGRAVATVAELRAALQDAAPVIVCRAPLAADEAAGAVRDVAEYGEPATLLIDEISPALKVNPATGEPMERVWQGPSLLWLCLQGGGLAASLVQLAQLPRMLPGSLLDNATAYVFFGTGGRSLDYARELKLLPPAAAARVASLAVGECCIFYPDREWDGVTYGPG